MSSTFVRVGHLPTPDPRESQASRDLAAMAPIMNRVHEGAVRMQAGGEVVNSGPARYQHSEASLAETGSVMATRSGSGVNETVEIAPGQRTNLATAARLGFIVSDGRGGFMDAPGKPRA